jgi:predicted permease
MRTLRVWWSRIAGFLRPGAGEQDFAAELESHIQLHTDDNIRAGMTPAEARRQALARLGSVAGARDAHRDRRGLPGLGALLFDLKLGGRMLVKYPGLTIVGGLAMGFAICVGTVIFQVLSTVFYPSLPLPQGDRLVQIRNWDVATMNDEPRALHDFNVWRNSLQSVTELGAWRNVTRNLIVTTGDARSVQVAEITASAFRVAGGTPLMGRVLGEADERPDAPAVAVIGYDVWQTRFGGDSAVLGRSAQLGTDHVAIVGVMREGFEFPVAHDVWTPLRVVNDAHAPRSGPEISVFGLLAPGATLETAQAELSAVGQRVASERPTTHAQLQAHVAPYAMLNAGPSQDDTIGIRASIYLFAVMLLVLVCSNVALLLFARAATRESEFTMRTALGASRRRIVAQLFAEALVLGGVAGVAGLLAAHVVLQTWGVTFLEVNLGRLPFWYDLSLSPATVLFALGLTILGSAIAGVMPALKVTRGMGSRLKQATAGAGGLQFGGIWTVVIVAQVAVTVAFPAVVYQTQWQLRHVETFDAGFPTEEYLGARIQLDTPTAAGEIPDAVREAERAAFARRLEDLRQRVAGEPGVAGVTFVDRLPRAPRPEYDIELPQDVNRTGPAGESGEPGTPLREATVARIDPSYFDTLETSVLAGRAFGPADVAPGVQVAIVDQSFVDQVLQGRNPIGQQVRFASQDPVKAPYPWMQIVGVVKDLGMGAPSRVGRAAGLYLPSSPERLGRVYMMVHLRDDAQPFAPKLHEIATAVDPTLRLSEVQRVDKVTEPLIWFVQLWVRVTAIMTAVALVLSLSGIYAVLSFIVARRTREIGVRVALGASRVRVVSAIFRRPLIQVGLGVLAGSALLALAGSVKTEMPGLDGELSAAQLAMLAAYGVVMLGVCLLACIVPTRRALSVEPTVALRMD